MDNPEKLTKLGTQDTRQRQKKKIQHNMCWTPPHTRQRQIKQKTTTKQYYCNFINGIFLFFLFIECLCLSI